MRNNLTVISLIVLVAIIWLLIFLRIGKLKTPNEKNKLEDNTDQTMIETTAFSDSKLQLNYVDPFDIDTQKENMQKKKQQKVRRDLPVVQPLVENKNDKAVTKRKPKIPWPQIEVKGVISKTQDNEKYISMVVDNKPTIVKRGENIKKDFQLQRISLDSIFIQYKFEIKSYAINN